MSKREASYRSQFSELPLSKVLADDALPAIQQLISDEKLQKWMLNQIGDPPVVIMPAKNFYAKEVNRVWDSVARCFERIDESAFLIEKFPKTKAMREVEFTQKKWIEYHLSQFFASVYSIGDTALHFVNLVFELGVLPANCNQKTVTENQHVGDSGVAEVLRKLDGKLGDRKRIRNLDAHRATRPDVGELVGFKELTFIMELISLTEDADDSQEIAVFRSLMRASTREAKQRMYEIGDEIFPIIDELQNTIMPKYVQMFKSKISWEEAFEEALEKARQLDAGGETVDK